MLFQEIGGFPEGHFLQDLTFCPGTLLPATNGHVCRVGRPRHECAMQVHKKACEMAAQNPAIQLDSVVSHHIEFERMANLYILSRS